MSNVDAAVYDLAVHGVANDVRAMPMSLCIGDITWAEISALEEALAAGDMVSARASARYVAARLDISTPLPESDAAGIWACVVRVFRSTAAIAEIRVEML